ncbi:hypothetical protein HMI54_008839, partial [Coelomomyces lativittatus]
MNTLFAESSIQLQCRSGECLHVTQVPSSDLPGLMELSGWMYVGLVSALFSLLGLLGLCFFTRRSPQDMSLASSSSSLLNTDTDPLLNNHLPITLAFEHVTYHVATTSVLHQVHGYARPGQLTAIMGSSGAGKSTLLDLLAHREKSGVVREGGILSFNGRQLPSETYSRVVGYVDQEDTLMFAESSIQLQCRSGECLHVTQVPSSDLPGLMELSGWMYVGLVSALFSLLGLLGLCFFTRRSPQDMSLASSSSSLLNTDTDPLLNNHLPITLAFEHVTYHVATTSVLHQVHGYARPGQLTAIMGSSGAGKSTLLDLLAHREKSGVVREGGILSFNGRQLPSETYSRVVGYVDQEDTLMSTLTVEETILYSALLRLPSDMSYEAKVSRVKATMVELGIAHLANQRIGNSSKRGISGGEKRRVSIACEMVTSPSVLLLDEPTSGLDAFNAYKVVECLMNLARTYQRTIVLTIHQPRSNIFALFDTLILLSKGNVVYSGEAKKLADHLKRLGYPCPPGYNLADYLMDLTFKQTLPSEVSPYMSFNVQDLIAGYHASTVFKETQLTIKEALIPGPLVLPNHSQRPGFWNQFKILASRTFKHTLRHPSLLLMHYLIAIVVALLCGTMFWQLSNDIPGFQNRLGCFFFITSLFMFSCLSSIHVFAQDRILFTRERANGYYQPITFFLCKTFFDLIPLRVFPPIVLGLVMYPMVGLVNLPW